MFQGRDYLKKYTNTWDSKRIKINKKYKNNLDKKYLKCPRKPCIIENKLTNCIRPA